MKFGRQPYDPRWGEWEEFTGQGKNVVEVIEDRARQLAREDYADELASAERRIATALALHERTSERLPEILRDCRCGYPWDTTLDRCSSPTVTALVEGEGE